MSSAHLDHFCGRQFWNKTLSWDTNDPDLTPCFERTCLVWTQSLVLFALGPLDIYYMVVSKSSNIPWSWRNISKMLIVLAMAGICVFDFVYALVRSHHYDVYGVDVWTPVIRFLSAGFALVLMFFHRRRGQVRSGLLFCYWLLIALLGIPQFRTDLRLYQNEEEYPLPASLITYMVYYLLACIVLLLNFLAEKPPREIGYRNTNNPSPEETASFPSRILFSWFDPFALLGFRRPLEEKDMFHMCYEDRTSELIPLFEKYWHEALKKNKGKFVTDKEGKTTPKHTSILIPIFKAFGPAFIMGGVFKLVNDILTFVGPQILRYLVAFCAEAAFDKSHETYAWKGYMYAAVLFIVAVIQTLFLSQYFMRMYSVGIRIRTSLTACIYRKALVQSGAARKDSTLGEIVNLMAVDAQRFMDLTAYLHMMWSAPFQIILSIYFLYGTLGPSVFAGLGSMLILMPLNGFIVNKLRNCQVEQMKAKDERVKTMNEILSGIKVLKLYAWDPSFEDLILKIRNKEMNVLTRAAYYSGGISFVWTCAPFLVSFVSFAVFVLSSDKNVLDSETAFVAISLFNILRAPLSLLPMMVTSLVQTGVSVNRINKFMNGEEIDQSAVTHDTSEADPVVVENASFSWGEADAPVLKNVNLRIKKGSLVAVVGSVGAAKSSLLCSFLGEMKKLSGRVNVHGRIAYVPQLAWIQNATLQNNILFGSKLDSKRYWKVIEACALKPDLDILPGGDQTEIGEKGGINLSGGQKQRVSLARAVYCDSDLYFFDDPLSAVDSHVGKHIFENVIGPDGILKDKTRVLVTHGLHYLPNVDLIIVLKDGSVSEMGTYNELLSNRGDFNTLVMSQQTESNEESQEEVEVEIHDMDTVSEMEVTLGRENSIRKRGESAGSSLRKRRTSSSVSKRSIKEIKSGEKLIESEKKEIGKVKWAVYLRYFRSIGLRFTSIILFFDVAYQAFSIASSLWLSRWTSDNAYVMEKDHYLRNKYLSVYGGLGLGQFVTTFIFSIMLALGCVGASRRIHHDFLFRIMRAPMSFFDTTPIGRIINLFSKDMDVIDNLIPMNIQTVMLFFFTVVATIFIICYSTPIFLSVVVPIFILYYLIQKFYIATSRQLKRLESVSRSPIYSHFGESVTGTISIRAYGAQQRFIMESEDKVDFNQRCTYPNLVANRWLAVRLETVGNLIIFFSALFAVVERNSINPGMVGLSISYSLQITQILNWLVRMISDVETNIVSVERIKDYDFAPQEAAWELSSKAPSGWPQEGKVTFDNFSVRYREGLDLVLRGLNFHIGGMEKVGIVGRTGAGKSSMTLSLFRIVEAAEGTILIDGVDISKLGLLELRSRLTIIPQDPVLFSGSLRINLDPFGKYSDQELWTALENAHLKNFIKTLSAGLDHEITEGGENLSVGQRQLVCLARALLRKTKVLVLDEATAAIDIETDELIQRTIRTEFASCTVLTIAHRINTIMDSDRVMVLDKGQIVEFDSPSTLLKSKSSIFYGMAHNAGIV